MARSPEGRARDASDRAALLRRLGAVWDACPSLRLGQLIANVVDGEAGGIFYVEDHHLVSAAEKFYAEHKAEVRSQQGSGDG